MAHDEDELARIDVDADIFKRGLVGLGRIDMRYVLKRNGGSALVRHDGRRHLSKHLVGAWLRPLSRKLLLCGNRGKVDGAGVLAGGYAIGVQDLVDVSFDAVEDVILKRVYCIDGIERPRRSRICDLGTSAGPICSLDNLIGLLVLVVLMSLCDAKMACHKSSLFHVATG